MIQTKPCRRLATGLGFCALGALLLSCGSPSSSPPPGPGASSASSSGALSPRAPVKSAGAFADQVAAATQSYRTSKGRAALTRHSGLDALATQHAGYMARTGHYAHDGWPARNEAMHQQGIVRGVENVNRGRDHDTTRWTPAAMNFWINSKGHHRNLLEPSSTHYGVGAVIGSDGFFNVVYISGALRQEQGPRQNRGSVPPIPSPPGGPLQQW